MKFGKVDVGEGIIVVLGRRVDEQKAERLEVGRHIEVSEQLCHIVLCKVAELPFEASNGRAAELKYGVENGWIEREVVAGCDALCEHHEVGTVVNESDCRAKRRLGPAVREAEIEALDKDAYWTNSLLGGGSLLITLPQQPRNLDKRLLAHDRYVLEKALARKSMPRLAH